MVKTMVNSSGLRINEENILLFLNYTQVENWIKGWPSFDIYIPIAPKLKGKKKKKKKSKDLRKHENVSIKHQKKPKKIREEMSINDWLCCDIKITIVLEVTTH